MPNNITISGPKNPPIGRVGAYYSINLPKPKDSNMTYRWFIYRPGSEKTLIPGSNKEGIKVNFSFDDQWKNKTYLIKVFECLKGKTYKELFEAGKLKKELASFEITPKEAVNTKILNPEILKVDHRKMGDGDPNKVSYQDTLLVWAETQDLQNKEITFKLLWNNDKEPKKVFKAKVDNKGRAEVKIPLSTHPDVLDAYVKNKTSKDKSTEHTFKVEASFGEPPKTNGKKATQVKGKIKDVYFIDKNNKKVTKIKKGDVVRVRIESEGMINKSFQYFILEKDKYTPDDSITSSGVLTFKDDIFIGREIEIDDEKLLWGGKEREGEDRYEQNYTIEVKTFSDSKGSKPFQITTEDLKVEYGISAVKVTTGEVNKNTKTLPAYGLFLPDIQIKEVYEVKDDKNVSLEPDKEADKHIKVLDEKTSVATEYKEKDITTVKQTNSMIIRFSVTPKGGKKVGYLGLFLSTSHEAEILYANELYYNYKNVLSPNIASITIKEGEIERPFGSGYTTKINGKETEFELKIVFNKDKKISSDVFIDIFSNTNAALAKPTLSGSALHRFKMKITKEMVKATVVVVSGKGSKKIGNWVVYKTDVYNEMTIEQYKEYKKNNSLPSPDFTTYLARDAHSIKKKYGRHSPYRYGKNNEAPPGEYYLIKKKPGQKHSMYLSDKGKYAVIKGVDGERVGIAIHKFSPDDAIGCLTTVSGKKNKPVEDLYNSIKYWDNVKIILEEREVEESNWNNKNIGETKWTGKL
ncbi:hypothetical protein [Capnocytophaga sputigena]|uniref:hypothetical protein n=1 Tax=Capnocytophaga sputigena TaxID=1019 RepID=UPI0028EC74E9|nr:hypothetical protein [Capnocytophaga sputigena]